jgi:membrane associated rhomboid family serine protease
MADLFCPDCSLPLQHSTGREGAFWRCPRCEGHTAGVAQLRHFADDEFIKDLWNHSRFAVLSARACPSCAEHMALVSESDLEAEVCRRCHIVWLDRYEWDDVPRQEIEHPPPAPLPDEAAEIMAAAELEAVKRRAEPGGLTPVAAPEHWWQWILGFLGFPLREGPSANHIPAVTWSVAALMIVVSVMGFRDVEETVQNLGLIPADPARLGGMTLLTSFLVHGSWFHLLGNLYFLMILGHHVEYRVGPWRTLAVIAAAALAGDLAHAVLDPRPEIPLVGASAGIFGLLAFYAIAFRDTGFRLFIFLLFPPIMRWVRLPALAFFSLYMFFQVLGAWYQLGGWSDVSSLAHIGGALAGVIAFWGWREAARHPWRSATPIG